MTNYWMIALKRHNKGKNTFCIPRKGTAEYKEVMKTKKQLEGLRVNPKKTKRYPKGG